MAERLNGLGSKHWQRFSGQDYFDPRGVFFTTLVSGPLVLIMLIVLVSICARVPRPHTNRMHTCAAADIGLDWLFFKHNSARVFLSPDKLPGFMLCHAGSSKAQGAHLQGEVSGKV